MDAFLRRVIEIREREREEHLQSVDMRHGDRRHCIKCGNRLNNTKIPRELCKFCKQRKKRPMSHKSETPDETPGLASRTEIQLLLHDTIEKVNFLQHMLGSATLELPTVGILRRLEVIERRFQALALAVGYAVEGMQKALPEGQTNLVLDLLQTALTDPDRVLKAHAENPQPPEQTEPPPNA